MASKLLCLRLLLLLLDIGTDPFIPFNIILMCYHMSALCVYKRTVKMCAHIYLNVIFSECWHFFDNFVFFLAHIQPLSLIMHEKYDFYQNSADFHFFWFGFTYSNVVRQTHKILELISMMFFVDFFFTSRWNSFQRSEMAWFIRTIRLFSLNLVN